jgi:murein L,D-transpeptidase YafK
MKLWIPSLIVAVLMSVLVFSQKSDSLRTERPMLGVMKDQKIIIRKEKRSLEVYDGSSLRKTFTVALGFAPNGDKEIEGDGKTPEGEFYVFTKNPKSKFHLSLGLSYPSKDDANRGFAHGLVTKKERDEIMSAIDAKKMPPQNTKLGGEIFIHGGGIGSDWTWGCVALKNEEIEELFETIPVGTKVIILP